jgi:kynurenine formamidase
MAGPKPGSADAAPVMAHDACEMHPAGRTGLEFYDLSQTFGANAPLWPYCDDVEIERIHYHAKSGVLSQRISTVMHCTTHWEPCHRQLLDNGIVGFENVGGDLDKVTGRRCTFAAFPIRWQHGDGSIVRLVACAPTGGWTAW